MANRLGLQYIAREINRLLGADFIVSADHYNKVEQDRTVCTIRANRVPFPLDNINSETLSVSLYFRVDTSPRAHYLKTTERINALLGYLRFENVEAEDAVYTICSYLEAQEAADPEPDSGNRMTDILLTGTMLVTDNGSGAVISNSIRHSFSFGGFEDAQELAAIACRVQLNRSAEAPNPLNGDRARPVVLSQSCTYTLTALFLHRALDYEIAKEIELKRGLGSPCYYIRTYPDGSETRLACVVLDGSLIEQAGAYAQYTLVLQEA